MMDQEGLYDNNKRKMNFRKASVVLSTLIFTIETQLVLEAQPVATGIYPVSMYGAAGIKDSICTAAIQKTIDHCALAGGGTVYFAPGGYTSGQLYLKSNVNIYIDAGATVYASRNPDHFLKPRVKYEADDQIHSPNETCLFYGDHVSNVSLLGKGTLDGQAAHTWEDLKKVDAFIDRETAIAKAAGILMKQFYVKEPKVRMVFINNARNIDIRGITVQNSPDWSVHLGNGDGIVIDGVTILSSLEKGVNSDGIDIDGCSNVRVSNCYISTGDDAICLKSTLRKGQFSDCRNIVVNNCTLASSSSALKIGTESHGNFKDIIFSNCVINSNRGINIVVRDGATVENVLFTDLVMTCTRRHFNWWGDGDPIRMVVLKRTPQSRLGQIRNVTIRNVIARGAGTSSLMGFEERPLENIVLENIDITMEAEALPDRRATDIMNIDRIKGLRMQNIKLTWDTLKGILPAWGCALRVQQAADIHLNQFTFPYGLPGKTLISLKQVKSGRIAEVNAWESEASRLIDSTEVKHLLVEAIITKENFKPTKRSKQ
ncbi:MAG: right-handed parallel beta-helix repeat-containing protein [Chitinophagaceae bacterium]|nr:right-handed parallel beta-helix repeat-containing protein [Chitinophagaceae bacterium]